jgi:hypothetical protein
MARQKETTAADDCRLLLNLNRERNIRLDIHRALASSPARDNEVRRTWRRLAFGGLTRIILFAGRCLRKRT